MKMRVVLRIKNIPFLLVTGILFTFVVFVVPAWGQSTSGFWNEAENLSNSGSASQVRIVAMDDGRAQAFWMDEFDGLMTSVLTEDGWSEAQSVGIAYREMSSTPIFILDANDNVHAFWLQAGAGSALWHSRAQFGVPNWSLPEIVAESALVFDVTAPESGGLAIAYIRAIHDDIYPSGVYARRWWNEGYWGMQSVVDSELYYRQWQVEETWLRIAAAGDGREVVVWKDPRRDQAYYSYSGDYGVVWADKRAVGEEVQMQLPRMVITANQKIMMITAIEGVDGCIIYQQELDEIGILGEAQLGLTGLLECPTEDHIYSIDDGYVWVWGQGSDQLSAAIYRPDGEGWSEVRNLDITFRDPTTDRTINLADIRASIGGGKIYLAGSSEESGDVWGAWAELSAMELMEIEPDQWTETQRLSSQGRAAGCMAVGVDPDQVVHVVWCEGESVDRPDHLYYAQWDEGELSKVVELLQAGDGEIIRQPTLAADSAGWIHLAWSGGETGEILYSRAKTDEALSASSWSEAKKLSKQALSASPILAIDDQGKVFILYIVPVNEGRGVYMTHSKDSGGSWVEAVMVFDAAAAQVGMVDHPGFIIEAGIPHITWVEYAGPDFGPLRIAYIRGDLVSESQEWNKPTIVIGAGYDWPQLTVANGALHIISKAEDGALWSRSIDLIGESWGAIIQVPGWPGSGDDIFGLAGTGTTTEPGESMLHLVGASPKGLTYGQWKEGRWSGMEEREHIGGHVGGVRLATLRQGGRLTVVYNASSADGLDAVFMIHREIETYSLELKNAALLTPTAVLVNIPIATETPMPTPTPDLNLAPAPGSSMPLPLMLGAGLALLVVMAGAAWGLRDKTNRRNNR